MKKLVEVYYTYGRDSGLELNEQFLIEDSKEARKEVLENLYACETWGEEEFLNMESNSIEFNYYGTDWDEATGGHCIIKTRQEAIVEIVRESMMKQDTIIKLFRGE